MTKLILSTEARYNDQSALAFYFQTIHLLDNK